MWVDILEPNQQSQYVPVECTPRKDIKGGGTGGVYIIRPRYAHRLVIDIDQEGGADLRIRKINSVLFGESMDDFTVLIVM